tara:strand:+ start:227 stop:487 length:261 start_codon:yes stop_codon:yes gene_type:complete
LSRNSTDAILQQDLELFEIAGGFIRPKTRSRPIAFPLTAKEEPPGARPAEEDETSKPTRVWMPRDHRAERSSPIAAIRRLRRMDQQ